MCKTFGGLIHDLPPDLQAILAPRPRISQTNALLCELARQLTTGLRRLETLEHTGPEGAQEVLREFEEWMSE